MGTLYKVVTGFTHLPGHPRAGAYEALGSRLLEICGGYNFYRGELEDTWLFQMLREIGGEFTHSVSDNPQKNTIEYQCVTHEKFRWLARAREEDSQSEVFIWIDYGVLHNPRITPEHIQTFLNRITDQRFAIPGCWAEKYVDYEQHPNWRFCGAVMVVPRAWVLPFYEAARESVREYILRTRNISWDVNTMARVELAGKIPIEWYQADHDETMFTAY